MYTRQEIKRVNDVGRELDELRVVEKIFTKAPAQARLPNLAIIAAHRGAGVVPCEINAAGEIVSPLHGDFTWASPLKDEARIRAAFDSNPSLNAVAIVGELSSRRFIGAPGFVHPARFADASKPNSASDAVPNSEAALRATVDRVINAAIAANVMENSK